MKKTLIAFLPWFFMGFAFKAIAQEDAISKEDKSRTDEIVIQKKGSKDVNLTIQFTGDKVLINGKPMIEFKDNEITVNKRKIIVKDRSNFITMDGEFNLGEDAFNWHNDDHEDHILNPGSAFLGVSTENTEDGAKITEEVSKESAAGKAGLEKGDIITKLDDAKIDGPKTLYEAVNSKKPNDQVKISYKRNGKNKTTKAVLQERKGSFSKTYSFSGPDGSYKSFTMPAIPRVPRVPPVWDNNGYSPYFAPDMQDQLGDLQMEFNGYPFRKKLGLKIQDTEEENGVKVLEVEDSSAAATAGLKKDDIIVSIGTEKVSNTDQARKLFQENREKAIYHVKALRNGAEMNFTIKTPKKLKTANL